MKRLANIIFCILLSSCTNYLTVQPQGEVIPKADEEFAAIVHNLLREIEGGGDEYIIGNMETIARLEGCADNLDANIKIGNNLTSYAGEVINKRQNDYKNFWKIVRDCNIIIENISGRTSEIAKNTLSAAYTIKGICYYNLIREFCQPWDAENASEQLGLPIVDRFDITSRPIRSNLKETVIYTKGLFEKSLELKPNAKLYIFTEYIVKAYLAKLLFWAEDWDSTISLCENIISQSGYSLTTISEYNAMINSPYEAKGEVLVRSHINNSSELDWYFSAIKSYIGSRPASSRLIALFGDNPEKDVRYKASFDANRMNIKIPECKIRISEIILMLSESYYHSGNKNKALSIINQLRNNRIEGVSPYSQETLPPVRINNRIVEDCTGTPITPLLQVIFDERQKELYMEGDRWFELKRNGRPEWWIINNGLKYTTKKYLYTSPIYKRDIELNPNIVQNPGYIG